MIRTFSDASLVADRVPVEIEWAEPGSSAREMRAPFLLLFLSLSIYIYISPDVIQGQHEVSEPPSRLFLQGLRELLASFIFQLHCRSGRAEPSGHRTGVLLLPGQEIAHGGCTDCRTTTRECVEQSSSEDLFTR